MKIALQVYLLWLGRGSTLLPFQPPHLLFFFWMKVFYKWKMRFLEMKGLPFSLSWLPWNWEPPVLISELVSGWQAAVHVGVVGLELLWVQQQGCSAGPWLGCISVLAGGHRKKQSATEGFAFPQAKWRVALGNTLVVASHSKHPCTASIKLLGQDKKKSCNFAQPLNTAGTQ